MFKAVTKRYGRCTALGAALLLANGSVSTAAQLKPESYLGSRISVKPEELRQEEGRRVSGEFPTCVAKKRAALASAYILDRSSFDFKQKYGRLAEGDCLQPSDAFALEFALRLDDESMRYSLAEALLRDGLADIDPMQLPKAPPIPIPLVYDYSKAANSANVDDKAREQIRAAAVAKMVMYKFGDCAVRADPVAARSLLQAPPGTDNERKAVDTLRPALGSCLEKGSQVTLNRSRLRGAIAVSYYSLAHAPNLPTR